MGNSFTEKEELVNLVLIHVNTQEAGGGYHSSEETCANPFDQIKQTCQSLFTTISDRIASGKYNAYTKTKFST